MTKAETATLKSMTLSTSSLVDFAEEPGGGPWIAIERVEIPALRISACETLRAAYTQRPNARKRNTGVARAAHPCIQVGGFGPRRDVRYMQPE